MSGQTVDPSTMISPSTRSSKKAQRRSARKHAAIEAEIATVDKLVAKRRGQLESALAERASLTAKLARLDVADDGAGPMAYCLKERIHVQMGGVHAVVLANGRPAIAGTCISCGSKLVRIGAS